MNTIPEELECTLCGASWIGTIKIKEVGQHHCMAVVKSRGTEFIVAITCYFEGYGMKEWCICVPNFNFGCKLSAISIEKNEEQFTPYIKNAVDRRSLACAVEVMLQELNRE